MIRELNIALLIVIIKCPHVRASVLGKEVFSQRDLTYSSLHAITPAVFLRLLVPIVGRQQKRSLAIFVGSIRVDIQSLRQGVHNSFVSLIGRPE